MFSKLRKFVSKDEEKKNGEQCTDDASIGGDSLSTPGVQPSQPFPPASSFAPKPKGPTSASGSFFGSGAFNSSGVRTLEPQLQRKFGRGVHYNMVGAATSTYCYCC